MNRRNALQGLASGLLAVSLLSCGGNTEKTSGNADSTASASTSGEKYTIAVIPKGSTHSHWKSVHAGAVKAGQELGAEIIWQGPQKEDDRQMQIQLVQNMVGRGVSAMVLAPLDDRSLVPPVKQAANRKIPVVIIDSGLQGSDFSSYVATDNFQGGKLCAKQLAEAMGGKGKVILLKYQEGSASTTEREAGFLEGMKEYGPNITFLSQNQYAGATFEKALQVSQNLLNQYSDVDGVFASNESATQGMLRALQLAGKAGKVKFVGFDVNPTLLAALKKDEILGFAVQDPFRMGYDGVKTAVAILKGQPYEKKVDTGVTLVTKANLEEPAVKELLNRDTKKWLGE